MNTSFAGREDDMLEVHSGPLCVHGRYLGCHWSTEYRRSLQVITWEGKIQRTERAHNHLAQPELYAKKQAR